MPTPLLTEIPLDGTCQNSHISTRKEYLVRIYERLYSGTFSKQHYGWSFNNWGTSGIQLNSVDLVWEIDSSMLPEYLWACPVCGNGRKQEDGCKGCGGTKKVNGATRTLLLALLLDEQDKRHQDHLDTCTLSFCEECSRYDEKETDNVQ